MIIIAGYIRTDAAKRDGAVDAFKEVVERARSYAPLRPSFRGSTHPGVLSHRALISGDRTDI